MKCDKCKKREANIEYSENINGKKQKLNLCYECAEKLGVIHFSNSFVPMFSSMFESKMPFIEEAVCDQCGYTLEDYKKTGLFGCDHCYEVFEDHIDDLLLKIHGKNRHVSQTNVKTKVNSKQTKLEELKEKLEKVIKEEKYEEAAVIRDEIKKIEGGK